MQFRHFTKQFPVQVERTNFAINLMAWSYATDDSSECKQLRVQAALFGVERIFPWTNQAFLPVQPHDMTEKATVVHNWFNRNSIYIVIRVYTTLIRTFRWCVFNNLRPVPRTFHFVKVVLKCMGREVKVNILTNMNLGVSHRNSCDSKMYQEKLSTILNEFITMYTSKLSRL